MTDKQLIYPGAKHVPSPAPTSDMSRIDVGVFHTTEGGSLPDYEGGKNAPHLTLVPDVNNRDFAVVQHYPFNRSARSLVHAEGEPDTNRKNALQIEIVGTCNPGFHAAHPHLLFVPSMPLWAVDELAKIVAWFHVQWYLPMTSTVEWIPYPRSYGSRNGVRLSLAEWSHYRGWLGHEHVPENLHGDPGSLDIHAVLEAAGKHALKRTGYAS